MKKLAVLGSGSWASALVKVFSENINQLGWWLHKKETADFISYNSYHPNYLTQVKFPLDKIKIYNNLNVILNQYDVFVLAIPSIFIKEVFDKVKISISEKMFISSIKGIIPENNLSVIDFLEKKYQISQENLGIIAGPSHAEEMALGKTTYLSLVFKEKKKFDFIFKALNSSYIKTSYSNDIKGITLASILKNIFSIASGISKGLEYGDNFQAVLVSNSIKEMKNIMDKFYPFKGREINDLAYLGDLLVTSYSSLSRNYTLGKMLGEGKELKSIFHDMEMVAEGYYATKCIFETYGNKIFIPIIERVYKILYKNISPKEAFGELKNDLN